MPSNNRTNNQYYGKYRECCVVACLNNTKVEYNENYTFTEKEEKELYSQGKIIADFLGNHTAQYIGNHTIDKSGDILLDNGEVIEIKTVSAGSGTYFNTSIYYFEKFGFDFKKYMEKYGLYNALETNFGNIIKINHRTKSPVSQEASSLIRHNYEDLYNKTIVPTDTIVREHFIQDIANYFINNSEQVYNFIIDMLEKNSLTSKKTKPDRLIVLNYNKNIVKEINLKNFIDNISTNIKTTEKGLVIGNIRIALGWQNGVGLNNPTIRVFLMEE